MYVCVLFQAVLCSTYVCMYVRMYVHYVCVCIVIYCTQSLSLLIAAIIYYLIFCNIYKKIN